jgi:hypothetical protein
LDGVEYGIVSNIQDCAVDPYSLVGEKIIFDGRKSTISNVTAGIYRKILDGATTPSGIKLWYGMNIGTGFNGIHTGDLLTLSPPMALPLLFRRHSESYIRYFLKKDPSYDTAKITYTDFADLFA